MTGSAVPSVLATGGAVRGGAGMVRVVTAPVPAAAVRQAWPEAVLTTYPDDPDWDLTGSVGRVQAWVAGPGMGTGPDAVARLTAILRTDLPVLVDADGLTILSQHPGLLPRAAPTLITPHAGELARLLGAGAADIEARRLEHARRAASQLGVTVLLKGSTTVVASPGGGPVFVNPTGTPWLATAGHRRRAVRPGRVAARAGPARPRRPRSRPLTCTASPPGWRRPGPPAALGTSRRPPGPWMPGKPRSGPTTSSRRCRPPSVAWRRRERADGPAGAGRPGRDPR